MAQLAAQPRTPARRQRRPEPRRGDPAPRAAAALVDRYGPRLYRLARRLCGNEADAEDLVQDVFLQVVRKWDTFRGWSSPGTWLYSIAARSCKARMRRKGGTDKRAPAFSQVRAWREPTSCNGDASPLTGIVEHESADALRSALVALPEPFRLPLIFKEVLGLSLEQTAEALNLKPQTVKSRLHRARLQVRGSVERGRAGHIAIPRDPACRTLLRSKLEAMDRGIPFPSDPRDVCARCLATFSALDDAQRACAEMAKGRLPGHVRAAILRIVNRP